jgi:hypothetical protein
MIFNDLLAKEVEKIFKNEALINSISDLAAITIRLSDQIVAIPGGYYSILKQLAWHKINVVEVVSTFSEFNIILNQDDIDRAFSTIMNYFKS